MTFIVIDGDRLEYDRIEIAGACRNSATLVFLHEGLGSVSLWRDFPRELCTAVGRRGVVYSRLGYGRSDAIEPPRPITYLHHEAQRTLPKLLAALGIKSSVLIGHSDGASIALIATGTRAVGGVRGIILEAPHVFVEDVTIAGIVRAKAAYESGELRASLARHHGANVDGAFWGWNRTWLAPAFRAWNIENVLPEIALPVQVIQGTGDEYGTRAQIDAIVGQVRGPVESLMLDNCGHTPHREQRQAVLDAMARFIDRVDLRAAKGD